MNILLATSTYPPEVSGPANYIKELCMRLSSENKISVVAYTNTHHPLPNTTLISVSKHQPTLKRIFDFTRKVWKNTKGTEVIYVMNAMAAGLPVSIVSKLRGIPYVLKISGDEAWERALQNKLTNKTLGDFLVNPDGGIKIKIMMMLEGFVLRGAFAVTMPSEHVASLMTKHYGLLPSKITTNYTPAEKAEILPFITNKKPNQIVTTSKFLESSSIEAIVKSIATLKAKIPHIKLLVIGSGFRFGEIKTLVENLNLKENITFLGNISRAEIWHTHRESSLSIVDAQENNLPHSALISFATNVPAIVFGPSEENSILKNNQTVLSVNNTDEKELASMIEKVLADVALSNTLTTNATKTLESNFSWTHHISILEKILKSVSLKPLH